MSMKTLAKSIFIFFLFFVITVFLLRVDRQGAMMYGFADSISNTLQVFIENKLILR